MANHPIGFEATSQKALAEAAALNEALSMLCQPRQSRLEDYEDRVQRAVTAKDMEEAFGLEWERLQERIKDGPALTAREEVEFDLLERILCEACLFVEIREQQS